MPDPNSSRDWLVLRVPQDEREAARSRPRDLTHTSAFRPGRLIPCRRDLTLPHPNPLLQGEGTKRRRLARRGDAAYKPRHAYALHSTFVVTAIEAAPPSTGKLYYGWRVLGAAMVVTALGGGIFSY